MAASGDRSGTPLARIKAALDDLPHWLSTLDDASLGEPLIEIREVIDRSESVFADGVRRFDESGEYKADGALSLTAWLRWKCKLSGGAAAERVEVARQLEKLPQTETAFANGDVGYQHVAALARTAEHVGAAAVRKEEASLLQAARTMDPGQFTAVAKSFEHRVDAAGALAEANHAYQRRYLHIGEPIDGLVRLDGLLHAEGGATLRAALQGFMKPVRDDARSYGQRSVDALMELCRQGSGSKHNGAGPRPQLIIRAAMCRPRRCSATPVTARLSVSRARASWTTNSITPAGPSRHRPGVRSNRATAIASFRVAPGRRSGATGITWSGGPEAERRRYPTWSCYAARTIGWSTKKVGAWSATRTDDSRRFRPPGGLYPARDRPEQARRAIGLTSPARDRLDQPGARSA